MNVRTSSLLIFLLGMLPFSPSLFAQQVTISGTVVDETGEGLPGATVTFPGTGIGITTEIDGTYILKSDSPTNILQASFIGYDPQEKPVTDAATQTINFKLGDSSLELQTVTVTAKKGKYRKKNNPAVALMKKVIDNKGDNRLEAYDYYQHDIYEKVEMDLNNISEKFKNRKVFKKMKFIFDYVDTTQTDQKPYLPIYIQENSGTVYYRKSPDSKTEFRAGQKVTELKGYLDAESLSNVMEKLYEEVNIYDNNIELVTQQFVSPLSFFAPDFYAFYIEDTLDFKGVPVINLSFIPHNKQSLGFLGNIYVAIDSSYRVMKVDMGIVDDINLNFVKDIQIEQEFKEVGNNQWVVHKNNVLVEYNLTKNGMGFYGRRSVTNENFVFNQPAEDDKYGSTEKVVLLKKAKKQGDSFWEENRLTPLTESEANTYYMMDTLQRVPAFKRAVKLISFLLTGYTPVGPIDIGPVNAFYSFNPVEGFRPRLGGRTNLKFSKKLQLEGYLAYGVKDREFKHQFLTTYSFNENFEEYPRHYVRLGSERETRFPGQVLRYFSEDNFFLSFRRGNNTRMVFHTAFLAEYFRETTNNFAFTLSLENRIRRPYGSLTFDFEENGEAKELDKIQTSQIGLTVKWSPNAQYWNGKSVRIAMFNRYPIITLDYKAGLKGVLGGDYGYHGVNLKVFKRFYLSVLGYSNLEVEGGKIWGDDLPYMLLHLPRANTTFAYQIFAFNMMNFLEFSSDEYVTWNYEHYFNGFFFNRVPLLRKLKLREVISFKGLYGRLTDKNNPELDPTAVQFLKNANGDPVSYTLASQPYMEASIGVSNLFKFLRVDLVRRLSYLNQPNVPQLWGVKGLAIRGRFKVEF